VDAFVIGKAPERECLTVLALRSPESNTISDIC